MKTDGEVYFTALFENYYDMLVLNLLNIDPEQTSMSILTFNAMTLSSVLLIIYGFRRKSSRIGKNRGMKIMYSRFAGLIETSGQFIICLISPIACNLFSC